MYASRVSHGISPWVIIQPPGPSTRILGWVIIVQHESTSRRKQWVVQIQYKGWDEKGTMVRRKDRKKEIVVRSYVRVMTHVHLGSGRNSYQGHVNDSGEFWRVLGCTCIRCHWKRDIVDTFTHHFCTNRHGWIIGTSFLYIRKSERWHSSPVQYTCISSHLSWLYFTLQALLPLKPFTRWETSLLCCMLCCTTYLM